MPKRTVDVVLEIISSLRSAGITEDSTIPLALLRKHMLIPVGRNDDTHKNYIKYMLEIGWLKREGYQDFKIIFSEVDKFAF